ncbi:hypothetical protein TBLA_0B08420 [Henningerozyma blattae CBS 6284]|uniref:BHLH domain-containing protein n=1 Tax=Henningerozyma blattae (strain ATCC 34711 / CBS 6284 / DSM 70876 / NBRC 10599 / NRRL Y-10934 / UCD 77-7) TaxID=1071380 RepID=I2GZV5_HENB6|nr:hypothetical protein TBLA_0B08420 [Tetrapisispora blattae CBS 6284]CCH59657.1 hypothetical protein TBLA_0B08420 [Tetrapisispora blattae CBS 6284]
MDTTDSQSSFIDSPVPNSLSNSADSKVKKVRKPRSKKVNKLSQDQVRINHVDSEKRRRDLVRGIYDKLVETVPDLTPDEGRSEIAIYCKTINYLEWLYYRNKSLRIQLSEKIRLSTDPEVKKIKIDESLTWDINEAALNISHKLEE